MCVRACVPRACGLAGRVFTYFAEWCRDNRKLSSAFFKIPLDVDVGGACVCDCTAQ
jgi:hypothetical protein